MSLDMLLLASPFWVCLCLIKFSLCFFRTQRLERGPAFSTTVLPWAHKSLHMILL